jgi:hypothetical protein
MKEAIMEIEINGVAYVRKDAIQDSPKYTEDFVIVRCKDAGVHAGYLSYEPETLIDVVKLKGSRRLWRWWGKTLSGLALEGTFAPEKCRFGDPVDITLCGWCEILPCTERARDSLLGVAPWKND